MKVHNERHDKKYHNGKKNFLIYIWESMTKTCGRCCSGKSCDSELVLSGVKYKDIAIKHNVSLSTVKSWKTRYKWNRLKKNTHTKTEKSTHVKKVCKDESKLPVTIEFINKENNELTEKQKLFLHVELWLPLFD